MEPIRENRDAGPYDTQPGRSIVALKPDVICSSTLIGWVILIRNSWVDHDNLLLVAVM